jgi:hypothetical protein
MAREVIEKLIDDLDGGVADETVVFGIDGATYEVDLSREHAAALRAALAPYVDVGRRAERSTTVGTRRKPSVPRGLVQRDYDILQLREWAVANGIDLPPRGRIPMGVIGQYKAVGGR